MSLRVKGWDQKAVKDWTLMEGESGQLMIFNVNDILHISIHEKKGGETKNGR
jgi:hypothetical protein